MLMNLKKYLISGPYRPIRRHLDKASDKISSERLETQSTVEYLKSITTAEIPAYNTVVSLDQIRSFVAVAETKSITQAAQMLQISLPPLTRHIQALEADLSAPLFFDIPAACVLTLRNTGSCPMLTVFWMQ